MAAAEWQPGPGGPVEDHNRHAITLGEYIQRLMCRIRNPFHVRPHTPGDIQQQNHVNRHFFTREVSDHLLLAFIEEHEILGAQTGHGPIAPVQNLRIHAHQRHIAFEDVSVVSGKQ